LIGRQAFPAEAWVVWHLHRLSRTHGETWGWRLRARGATISRPVRP